MTAGVVGVIAAMGLALGAVPLAAVALKVGVGVTGLTVSHVAPWRPGWGIRLFELSAMPWSTPKRRCASWRRRPMAKF